MTAVNLIGDRADIMLAHENINNGDPIGFFLFTDERIKNLELQKEQGENVSIEYEVEEQDDGGRTMVKSFYFVVLLMKSSGRDGKIFTREEQRTNLLNIIGEYEDIELITREGVYAKLKADGHMMTETRFEEFSLISVRLVAENAVIPEADFDLFYASEWMDEETSTSKWDENYWR
jgi:hypothetical protein